MFLMHPILLGISGMGSITYYIYLRRKKALKTVVFMMIPVLLLSAIINPLFNHEGITLITYFRTGNPLTLESIVYGIASGMMLVSVLSWFSCYQIIMTSDKFIYIFGKIIPALSLIFSMVLRFVPKFKYQIGKVADAQKCIGRDVSNGNILEKSKHGMKILSIMTTWSLENSVETADSMRSRGYGLRGRVNFSVYHFGSRDKVMLSIVLVAGIGIMAGIATKQIYSLYFPMIVINPFTLGAVLVYALYIIICFLPVGLEIAEDIKWHYLKLKI